MWRGRPFGRLRAGSRPRSPIEMSSASLDSLTAVEHRIAAMPPIVLGKDMADNLGAKAERLCLVTSPQGELTPFGMVPKYNRFKRSRNLQLRILRLRPSGGPSPVSPTPKNSSASAT